MPSEKLLQQLDIKTLAVFRALQLGDMLCCVPALRALRAALPDTKISLVGLPWARQFAERYPMYIDDFVPFPGHPLLPEQAVQQERLSGFYAAMQARQFTLALQMHGSGEVSNAVTGAFGAQAVAGFGIAGAAGLDERCFLPYPEHGAEPVRLLALAEFLGAPAVGTHLEFPLTERDHQELSDSGLAKSLVAGGYICIHPGARIRDKCWAPQRFAEVADRLAFEFGLPVVLTGSAKEADLTAEVARHMRTPALDAAAPISIGAMAALMSRARLLVCNDTGVSHIAAGLKLKSVVIFSKADIGRWAPLDQHTHRCIWDPEGERVYGVLEHARTLLEAPAATP